MQERAILRRQVDEERYLEIKSLRELIKDHKIDIQMMQLEIMFITRERNLALIMANHSEDYFIDRKTESLFAIEDHALPY